MNEERQDILQQIRKERLIVILRGIPEDKLIPTVGAVLEGGCSLVEVTFDHTSREAMDTTLRGISALREHFGDALFVGAGTVLDCGDVFAAKSAGASFMISPHTDKGVITATRKMGLVSIPGAYTPTEIVNAYQWGADFVKLFPLTGNPAEYIRAVRAPLKHIPMLAVGGVSPDNLPEIMTTGVSGVGVGSGIAKGSEIAQFSEPSDFEVITRRVRQFRKALETLS